MEQQDQQEDKKKHRGIKKYFDIHPPVFWPSAIVTILFISVTLIIGKPMSAVFENLQENVSNKAGWFFIIVVNYFLFFMIYLAFSRYGIIRLGGKEAKPRFTKLEWFAMLFSAGMGIGILFWSVAEPIYHYINPAYGKPQSVSAAAEAMNFSFLHWGLHAWGIYALVGMALAFFAFNRKQPLAIRSVFYPVFGDRIHGLIGHIIDVLAVAATLFGLATSLGFGVKQINAGLNYVFEIPNSLQMQIILIIIITGIATFSVVSGLDAGVKRLSELNINLGGIILLFVIIVGPTLFILNSFTQNLGAYLQNFFYKSFWTESYQQTNWQNQWTIFYWSWWIAWSPFVGMFIARISEGRTVREFVLGVLIVPTVITFIWLTTFGGSAIFLEFSGNSNISAAIEQDVAISLYALLDNFPLSSIVNVSAVLLVVSFFVTSSDSGSLVVDAFTSGGKLNTPVTQRAFWAWMVGAVAIVLLIGGGLQALQTAVIISGLPFAIILLVMCRSLYKGLRIEYYQELQLKEEKEKESYKDLIGKFMHGHQGKDSETKTDKS